MIMSRLFTSVCLSLGGGRGDDDDADVVVVSPSKHMMSCSCLTVRCLTTSSELSFCWGVRSGWLRMLSARTGRDTNTCSSSVCSSSEPLAEPGAGLSGGGDGDEG
jgi:hypothetical protein